MDEATPDAPDALDESPESGPGSHVCPFLISSAGPWRSAEAARDHRCSRLAPDARLGLDHQRLYCLGSGGPGCPHYVTSAAPGRFVSMLPVVIDRGPLGATLEQDGLRRMAAPATVVIVGAALGALILARGPGSPGPVPGGAGSTATASPAANAPATIVPATAPPTASPGPSSTPVPPRSARPSATPPSSGRRTYTVRRGDTLGAIAAQFGTTTRVLVQLNGIKDPGLIRIGQVLSLP